MSDDLRAERRALVTATLSHVPFDGWTARALGAGARDLGLDTPALLRLCPRGIEDVVADFGADLDDAMLRALAPSPDLPTSVRQRIALAVRARLDAAALHREALRALVGRAALPGHAPAALAALYRTVDAIWYAVGDRSTDFSFYTKRALLAGVYGATLLYWLDDDSMGASETWSFLERRIADVMQIARARGRVQQPMREFFGCIEGFLGRRWPGRVGAPPWQTKS